MDPWYDYFAYITNHKGDLLSAYQFVVGRCNVENCIKESKIGFDGKEVPHKEYEANRAYLEHVQIAYNIKLAISMDSYFASSKLRRSVEEYAFSRIL